MFITKLGISNVPYSKRGMAKTIAEYMHKLDQIVRLWKPFQNCSKCRDGKSLISPFSKTAHALNDNVKDEALADICMRMIRMGSTVY